MDEDGGVNVAVSGEAWTFNPLCLAPAPAPAPGNNHQAGISVTG